MAPPVGPPARPGAPARALVADWSGAVSGEQRTLRLAEFDPAGGRVLSVRALRRGEAVDRILDVVDAHPDTVIGLDFAFSLPAWWLQTAGIAGVDELWGDAARLEGWLARGDPPFWGRPGRRRPALAPDREWRRTELALSPRPRSVFQIGGAGAVGTASLRGMPHLARLRAAGVGIWPWDPWRPPVAAEVWPRLAIGRRVKTSASVRAAWVEAHRAALPAAVAAAVVDSPDAFDAVAAALHLADHPPAPVTVDDRVRLEGWIAGAPDTAPAPDRAVVRAARR